MHVHVWMHACVCFCNITKYVLLLNWSWVLSESWALEEGPHIVCLLCREEDCGTHCHILLLLSRHSNDSACSRGSPTTVGRYLYAISHHYPKCCMHFKVTYPDIKNKKHMLEDFAQCKKRAFKHSTNNYIHEIA